MRLLAAGTQPNIIGGASSPVEVSADGVGPCLYRRLSSSLFEARYEVQAAVSKSVWAGRRSQIFPRNVEAPGVTSSNG